MDLSPFGNKTFNCYRWCYITPIKGVCSDPQLQPPIFGTRHPEVESYLEGCMCEVPCKNSVQFGRKLKSSRKWKTWLPLFYKAISKKNPLFSQIGCLETRYISQFVHLGLVGKMTLTSNLKKINFTTISEQAPLMLSVKVLCMYMYMNIIL